MTKQEYGLLYYAVCELIDTYDNNEKIYADLTKFVQLVELKYKLNKLCQ